MGRSGLFVLFLAVWFGLVWFEKLLWKEKVHTYHAWASLV